MSLLKRFLNKLCIHWKQPSTPDGFGQSTYAYPEQLKCCVFEENEKMIDSKGEEFTSKSKFYFDTTADIQADDWLKIGGIADIDDDSDYDSDYDDDLLHPEIIDGAYRIKKIKKNTSLNGKDTVIIVWV